MIFIIDIPTMKTILRPFFMLVYFQWALVFKIWIHVYRVMSFGSQGSKPIQVYAHGTYLNVLWIFQKNAARFIPKTTTNMFFTFLDFWWALFLPNIDTRSSRYGLWNMETQPSSISFLVQSELLIKIHPIIPHAFWEDRLSSL